MSTLKRGSRGDEVIELQKRLYSAGQHIAADGVYGEITERAVRNFQSQNGLTVDGIAGPKTIAALGGSAPVSGSMKTSKAGLDLIKSFEGFRSKAYVCPAGVLTIGYGHTGPDVKPGMVITEQRGTELLARDVGRFECAVDEFVKVPLSQNQYDALVSFTYNVGEGALQKSTLLKKLNAKDYAGAAGQFDLWNKGDGKVLSGLVRRRAAERKLFEGK